MVPQRLRMSHGLPPAGKVVLLLLAACCVAGVYSLPADQPPVYDVSARPVDLIPPGTVIGDQPPPGWSHLIVKSVPRTSAGDLDRVPATALELSSFLFCAFLADVEARPGPAPGEMHYRLARVGAGFGARVGGRDIILSPDSQRRLGADFGFLKRQALAAACERLQYDRVVARSDTLAVVDGPAYMLRGSRHRPVILRRALLVDARTGRLDALIYGIDRDSRGGYVGPTGPMEWLPPSKIDDCRLHVDASEFTLGLPSEKAFAMLSLPRGRQQIPWSDDLKALAAQPGLSASAANLLERKLRDALHQAAAAP